MNLQSPISNLKCAIALLGFVLAGCLVTGARAQGTVNFNNRVPAAGVDAPVYVFSLDGAPAAGTNFFAELFAGPAGTPEDSLLPLGPAVPFRTGVAAGYVDVGADASRFVPVAPGEPVTVQLRAWSADGLLTGRSPLFDVITREPLLPPVDLVGLQSFALIAEPGGAALLLIGLALLGFIHGLRRKWGER